MLISNSYSVHRGEYTVRITWITGAVGFEGFSLFE